MKKLKTLQLGPWCSFCPPKTTRAVYREDGFARMFCCKEHIPDLKRHEILEISRESRVTDADLQTWARL